MAWADGLRVGLRARVAAVTAYAVVHEGGERAARVIAAYEARVAWAGGTLVDADDEGASVLVSVALEPAAEDA